MSKNFYMPGHAYIPSVNRRHAEGCFDEIRKTACIGMSAEELVASSAFRHGLHYIETGFYWEAHEMLEPVWMALPVESSDRTFVQGLIQYANALLKRKMNRPKAALRLFEIAGQLLKRSPTNVTMNAHRRAILENLKMDKSDSKNAI